MRGNVERWLGLGLDVVVVVKPRLADVLLERGNSKLRRGGLGKPGAFERNRMREFFHCDDGKRAAFPPCRGKTP